MTTPDVALYGQFDSYWSNAGVTRGLLSGLRHHGLTVEPIGAFGAPDLRAPAQRAPSAAQLRIPVAIGVGYPVLMPRAFWTHKVKIGAFIAESSALPQSWVALAAATDLLITPSKWLAAAFIAGGMPRDRVLVVPHGLSPEYSEATPLTPPGRGLRFLHVAGSRDFLHRKGTDRLIEAIELVFGHGRPLEEIPVQVRLRIPDTPQVEDWIRETSIPEAFEYDKHAQPLAPREMREYYAARGGVEAVSYSAVIQPSRAEAFGLVPCEARALGLPVILTDATGHSQHIEREVDTVIHVGLDEPMIANGIPSGAAPALRAEQIATALFEFYATQTECFRRAQVLCNSGYYARNSWAAVTAQLAARIKDLV